MRAALATAEAAGLRCEDPVVLRDHSNLLVHLRPAPVVARVATLTARMRSGDVWLARELAVAAHLARAGAPVVAPSPELPPGPHHRDGLVLSFWTYAEAVDAPLDAREAGRGLRRCHEALADFTGALEPMGAMREAESVVDRLQDGGTLDPTDAAALRRSAGELRGRIDRLGLPLRPVHGDAHLGNAIMTADGPLWNDWEDAFLGPLAWDLACLHASARAFGRDPAPIAAAQAGYGEAPDPAALDTLVAARRLQGTAWSLVIAPERGAGLLDAYR